MRRALLGVTAAACALLAAGCGGGSGGARATTAATPPPATAPAAPKVKITLLGATEATGPWRRRISLRLVVSIRPVSFYVCAAVTHVLQGTSCEAAPGGTLPPGTEMRLEQHPAGPAVPVPGSPGWGTVASSDAPELEAVLSNNVTGNRLGRVNYRVTLRDGANRILARSNPLVLVWHA
jgi:hypothetical protein